MKELFVVVALLSGGASEEEIKQKVIQSQVQNTIVTEHLHISTNQLGTKYHQMQCWTTNTYHSDGSITPKVQCQ